MFKKTLTLFCLFGILTCGALETASPVGTGKTPSKISYQDQSKSALLNHDYAAAHFWAIKAFKEGDGEGAAILGHLSRFGYGCEKSAGQAALWYKISSILGEEIGDMLFQTMVGNLNPKQIKIIEEGALEKILRNLNQRPLNKFKKSLQ
jgi:hypothetical protein